MILQQLDQIQEHHGYLPRPALVAVLRPSERVRSQVGSGEGGSGLRPRSELSGALAVQRQCQIVDAPTRHAEVLSHHSRGVTERLLGEQRL